MHPDKKKARRHYLKSELIFQIINRENYILPISQSKAQVYNRFIHLVSISIVKKILSFHLATIKAILLCFIKDLLKNTLIIFNTNYMPLIPN